MPVLAIIGEGLAQLEFSHTGHDKDHGPGTVGLAPGGDAANIAVMAARSGAATRLGGRVGADLFGVWLREWWRHTGVDVTHVAVDPDAATGLYLNTPSGDGQRRFTYWRAGSAGSRLTSGQLGDDFYRQVGIVVVTGVTAAVSRSSAAAAWQSIDRAARHDTRVACVLNHRPALGGDPGELAALARAADIVIGSAEDASAVFGHADPERLAGDPLPVAELVLTDGPNPVVAVTGETVTRQPVPAMDAVDAAGAGDAFAGAYLARRLAGRTVDDALAWGVAAASWSVTRLGCAASYPTQAQVSTLAGELLATA